MFAADLLAGHRILVTGGGTGLGKSMTRAFMALGAETIIWGRRGGVLDETAGELRETTGGTCTPMAVDIRSGGAIDDAMEKVFADRPLTGLVNNAAGNFVAPTETLSPRAFDAVAGIVAAGTFNTTVAAGKRWIAGGHRGAIVSIVTTWVWNGGPFTVPSAMSKAGVAAMTHSLAVEWGRHGIRANAIAPGPFPSKGMSDRLMPAPLAAKLGDRGASAIPLGRWGELSELDNLAVFLLSGGCDYLTGAVIPIDGGQWLVSGGNFAHLSALDAADWSAARDAIAATNAADRAQRTT